MTNLCACPVCREWTNEVALLKARLDKIYELANSISEFSDDAQAMDNVLTDISDIANWRD